MPIFSTDNGNGCRNDYDVQSVILIRMNNKKTETYRIIQNGSQNIKITSLDSKKYTTNGQNIQNRLMQYDHLARRAKQQLKELENKRKKSPEITKNINTATNKYNQIQSQQPLASSPKNNTNYTKELLHSYSQKYFKRDNHDRQPNNGQNKHLKTQYDNYENKRDENVSVSPKKKFLDSTQYKKLHQKLDSIENKITDMKKNLQRKKEDKIKTLENKYEKEKQNKVSLKGLVTQILEKTDYHTFNSNPYSPRHNIYYVSQLVRAYMDQRSLARQHLVSSLNILKLLEKSKRLTEDQIKKVRLNLGRKKGYQDKKTIIFDLDETLIHCNDSTDQPYDVKLPIKFPTGELIEAGINIRPYARQILKNLSRHFQIIVFTASHSCYANVVVDYIDPNQQWIHHRLCRQHCFLSQQNLYVKDLRIINRDMKDMVLVDNAAYSYAYQLQNGIPILPYYHGQIDFQLRALEEYLMKMVMAKDMRTANIKTFKLTQYKNYYNQPQALVKKLYINQ